MNATVNPDGATRRAQQLEQRLAEIDADIGVELELGLDCAEQRVGPEDRRAVRRGGRRLSDLGPCPHCAHERPAGWHLKDAGDMPLERAVDAGYCPTLHAARGAR